MDGLRQRWRLGAASEVPTTAFDDGRDVEKTWSLRCLCGVKPEKKEGFWGSAKCFNGFFKKQASFLRKTSTYQLTEDILERCFDHQMKDIYLPPRKELFMSIRIMV